MKELSGKDWQFAMLDESPFTGIRMISYSYTQEIEGIKALGQADDYSFIEQDRVFEGEITFTESAYNRLIYKLPPGQFITDLPPIIITGQQISKETGLRQKLSMVAKFKGMSKEVATGGGLIEVACPLYISQMIENLPL